MKLSDLNIIKDRIDAELVRRGLTPIADAPAVRNEAITSDSVNALINSVELINTSPVSPLVEGGDSVSGAQLKALNTRVNELRSKDLTKQEAVASDCRSGCTGGCVSGCAGTCKATCTGTCQSSCGGCASTCTGGCSGCGGCSSCTGCGGCSGSCSGSCSGGCATDCTGSCLSCTGGCAWL